MNDKTLQFFAKYCLGELKPKDFSDWAIFCIENGSDSKNLRILASMFDVQYRSEIEPYFIKSLNDLNLNYPKSETYLPEYAKLIVKQIINKEISAIDGCHEIYKVYRHLEHEPELVKWDYLYMKMHPETYEDLVYKKNGTEITELWENAIIEEASKMIYGKITKVHEYKTKPEFAIAEEKEDFFTKLWKKIF